MTSGLRERKKQQTRELISDVATELFFERGFDTTTVADVAAAADVARMTVTNYFALKEDLVFDRHDEIARMLADAVRERPAGRSVLDAVRAAYLDRLDARDPILGFIGVEFARLVQASPALLARECQIYARQESELADAVRAAVRWSRADLGPALAAAQLAVTHRVLCAEGRRRLLAGESTSTIVRALRRAANAAYDGLRPALPASLVTA